MPQPAFTVRAEDQRGAVRFDTVMPLELDGGVGATQNISATGICFEADARQDVGSLVHFTLEYRLGGRAHRLDCEAKVVRVDERDGRVRISARMVAPFFDETDVVEAPLGARTVR